MTDTPLKARDELDLGDNHRITFTHFQGERRVAGGVEHLNPATGTACTEWIPFEGRTWAKAFRDTITTWKVEQDDPLTLSPSILCRACGDHGFIRDGKWVRA